MLPLEQLKQRVSLYDLAQQLGLTMRSEKADHYVFLHENGDEIRIKKDEHLFITDHQEHQGHCIDLVMYIRGVDYQEANRTAHLLANIHYFEIQQEEELDQSQKKIAWIASQCIERAQDAKKYLVEERKIHPDIVDIGIAKKTLGWTNYTNAGLNPGEKFYGGDGVSFVCYQGTSRVPVAIDHRYLDKDLNGGLKTMSQGIKNNVYWTLNPSAVKEAHTVYVCEGAIDAMAIETAFKSNPGVIAIAQRGTQNRLDFAKFSGKRIICCFDKDEPKPDKRNPKGPYRRAGQEAAWEVHRRCLAENISCMFVDQRDWEDGEDANDILKREERPGAIFSRLEPWLIPGLIGNDEAHYKRRIFLPTQDFSLYWRFQVSTDFTRKVKITKNDEGEEILSHEDVAGMRIAGISKVEIASATATMTGEEDLQPRLQFVAQVQLPRHGSKLQRRVLEDEQLHNIDQWKKFGPVYKATDFARIVNIFERSIDINGVKACNFVGIAWLNGRPVVNEGNQCFFTDPKQQCPYSNVIFSRSPKHQLPAIIEAYQGTFKNSAALLPLIWIVGAQLKAFLGFWPHLIMQASKGEGKSTLIKRLERTTGMKMFSGQSLATEFRLLTSISATSHPIGWEEISARKTDIINKAVSLLQESYQYTATTRGAALTEFLISAPVLLAGEDVPVDSLLGKTIRTDLTGKRGPLMEEGLPQFPMHEWMTWLVELGKSRVLDCYSQCFSYCKSMCRARKDDTGAQRMITNYSGLLAAWRLLSTWGGWEPTANGVERDIISEMNWHIADTSNDREPWIWILETILDEIAAQRYPFAYSFESTVPLAETDALTIRINQIMSHFSTSVHLREKFNALPVKSGRVLKQQLKHAGIIIDDDVRRSIHGQSVGHMTQLSLKKMETFGLYPSIPELQRGNYSAHS